MNARRRAVRRFTRLALAAGLILVGGATSAKAESGDAWNEGVRQAFGLERDRGESRSELTRERRKRRAELRREFRKQRPEDDRGRGKASKEVRKRRGRAERERRFREWREPDPPRAWRRRSR